MSSISIIAYREGALHIPGWPPLRAAIGKSGLTADKHEGDNQTPIGSFLCRELWYRPDRVQLPEGVRLPARAITPADGWCDDASHAEYNRHITLPHPARHEKLWRDDHVYDLMIPLGYNDEQIVPGKGSAIFWHLAHEDWRGTEGCIAITREDMLALIARVDRNTLMIVG